jgi:membrane associated rhomboid family serine protease
MKAKAPEAISENNLTIFLIPLAVVLFISLIHVLKVSFFPGWIYFGIYPREIVGLRGIIFAPFLHSDISHLFSNISSLFIILMAMMFFYRKVVWSATSIIFFLTGFITWLIARPTMHVGASGVIFGMISFVLWSGIFRRNARSAVISFTILILFGGIFAGLLPGKEGISWESHLSGFLVGMFTAFIFRSSLEEEEKIRKFKWEDEGELEEQYFLPRDAFDKTLEERRKESEEDRDNLPWYVSRS